jgi:hypothetical protein
VQIPQEGTLQIITINDMDSIDLYYQNGYDYEYFTTAYFSENFSTPKILLLPGLYKAVSMKYIKGKKTKPITITFQIKSNQETFFEMREYPGKTIRPEEYGKQIYSK